MFIELPVRITNVEKIEGKDGETVEKVTVVGWQPILAPVGSIVAHPLPDDPKLTRCIIAGQPVVIEEPYRKIRALIEKASMILSTVEPS